MVSWSGTTVLALCLGLQSIIGAQASHNHVLHEKRGYLPAGWEHQGKPVPDARILLKIGLKQQNLNNLESVIMKVSDPSSPSYGQHYTAAELATMFEPSKESIQTVYAWLLESGISKDKITLSPSKGWIHADVTVAEAETLLLTQYQVYQHKNGRLVARTDAYHVARHVSDHIDLITPTIDFDPALVNQKPHHASVKRSAANFFGASKAASTDRSAASAQQANTLKLHKIGPKVVPFQRPTWDTDVSDFNFTMENCAKYLTIPCIRKLYNIPYLDYSKKYSNSSLAIFTQSPDSYLQYDLEYANSVFNKDIPAGTTPIIKNIDGWGPQDIFQGSYNVEANLDIQVTLPMLYPANVTIFEVGDHENGATFNTFLDGIDASYCNTSGKPEEIDPPYPNPSYSGYHKRDCGTVQSTSVVSFSYGSYEDFMISPKYAARQCNEWGKLGATGLTFLGASGDDGVSVRQCWRYDEPVTEEQKRFVVTWPSSCPWFTSIGATEFLPGKYAWDKDPEMVAINQTQSGGGFSNLFPVPEYQKSAVETYFKYYTPEKAKGRYNATGTRGYPDLSAAGTNFMTSVQHELALASGTSLSCPIIASMVAQLNLERADKGKGPLGFINPALYAHPEMFNDITIGGNPGCHGVGFDAVPGWDPTSGLGTLDYAKFAATLG